jgi:hypothetical protein
MPDRFFYVVNLKRLHILRKNIRDLIISITYKKYAAAAKQNENLVGFIMSLHGFNVYGQKIIAEV